MKLCFPPPSPHFLYGCFLTDLAQLQVHSFSVLPDYTVMYLHPFRNFSAAGAFQRSVPPPPARCLTKKAQWSTSSLHVSVGGGGGLSGHFLAHGCSFHYHFLAVGATFFFWVRVCEEGSRQKRSQVHSCTRTHQHFGETNKNKASRSLGKLPAHIP